MDTDFAELLGPELTGALEKKGFSKLTPVQEAVLDPALSGRDLRISSQTGSGKTVALGFVVRAALQEKVAPAGGKAAPRVLVIVPTRELAKQVQEELSWLFSPLGVRVASVTGGGGYRDEMRAFASGPAVVVGTPGRLLDHLNRGGVDASGVREIVLDEADRMLDLGFRDDLEAILAFAPDERRTHLVSATFSRDVRTLADRVQRNAANVEGTPLGSANADIEHVVHLVHVHERLDAVINLLLSDPESQSLVFARTRADVAAITRRLSDAGLSVDSLSGEMEQRERNRALQNFKHGDLHALVATDVAARGIDVEDIARVIHVEPPSDPESYTHRSGRTGRAGKKGTSSVLVSLGGLPKTTYLFKRAGIRFRVEPIPTAESIRSANDERLYERLTNDLAADATAEKPDARARRLAQRLVSEGHAEEAIYRMIVHIRSKTSEPREVTPVRVDGGDRDRRPMRDGRDGPMRDGPTRDGRDGPMRDGPMRDGRGGPPMRNGHGAPDRDSRSTRDAAPRDGQGAPERGGRDERNWVSFRVTWGQGHGADARRLLAMVCRRGGIRGSEVGAIRVSRNFSVVDVEGSVADAFAKATRDPDPRDPRVEIKLESAASDHEARGDSRADERRPLAPSAPPVDRPSKTAHKPPSAPADRPSRSANKAPADRPSRGANKAPADRPSASKAPADRPSASRAPADRPSASKAPADRPSRSANKAPADRPSRSATKAPADRPSRSANKAPADRPSRSANKPPADHRPSANRGAPDRQSANRAPPDHPGRNANQGAADHPYKKGGPGHAPPRGPRPFKKPVHGHYTGGGGGGGGGGAGGGAGAGGGSGRPKKRPH